MSILRHSQAASSRGRLCLVNGGAAQELCRCRVKQKRMHDWPAGAVQNTKGEIVEELGELLVEAGMQNVLPLPKARVPVVKFVVGENGTKVISAGIHQD